MIKKSLLLMLLMALLAPWAANAQETLTVCDGSVTNGKIPVNGLYVDTQGTTSEFIIPATTEGMDGMVGGTITKLTFYIPTPPATWGSPTIQLYMGEVTETTLSALHSPSDFTIVSESDEWDNTQTTIEVVLDDPYTYLGGNLLIGTYVKTKSSTYKTTNFAGISAESGASRYNNGSGNGTAAAFLPKTTFTYEAASTGCDMPTSLVADPVEAHEATLTWDGSSDTYAIEIKGGSYTDWYLVEDYYMGKTITISGLSADTPYQARVQSICTSGVSNWKTVSFTTPIACPAPTGFAVTLTPGDGTVAEFSWTEQGTATLWQLCLDDDETHLIDMDNNPFTYDQFTPEQTYTAKVRAYCDDIDQSTWSNTITFTPTDAYSITVNDGTKTNGYIPVYGYYVDGSIVSQFIMPAADLAEMQYGTINQLTFYASQATVGWANAMFEVYMTEVDYTTFSSTTLVDWTTMDKVMNAAHLEISDNQLVVTLDAPYQYMGDNLMIGFKQTTSGTWGSSTWYGIEATGASLGGNNSGSQQNFLPKTTFAYTPGSAPACAKPTGLAVNYTGGTEATVSWNSEATAWNIDVNGTVTAITENPYTLTGLDLATTYEVKVQADCGGSQSEWTNAVSFTTDMCMPADQCELTFLLTDSYGDGWNGAYIDVVDVLTGESLAHMSNQNIAKESKGDPETETYTLAVCDGREIQFVWHAGSYDTECSYVVNDVNGEEIFSGSGAMSAPVNYTVSCTVSTCKKPTDLAASEIGNHSVKLNWIKNGEETEWVLAYSKDGATFTEVDVDAKPYTLTGLEAETEYTVKVRPVCSDFDDKWSNPITFTTDVACPAPGALTVVPTPFSATVTWTGDAADYTLRYVDLTGSTGLQYGFEGDMEGWTTIDADGDGYNWDLMSVWNFNGSPHGGSDMIVSMSYYSSSALTPDNYLVSPQITLGGSISFWVAAQDAAYPSEHFGVAVSTTGNTDAADFTTIQEWTLTAKGTGAKTNNTRSGNRTMGTWYQYTVDLSAYSGQGYVALRHFDCTDWFYLDVDDITIEEGGGTEPQWITVNNVTSPYEITGLDPETDYRVQVKALCGGTDGESVWTTIDFQTPSNCTAPFDLEANVLTESATISWTGYQDGFNAQYRTAATREELYFTNFNTDADRTGWTWTGSIIYGFTDPIYGYSSSENYFLQMGWATTSEATIFSPELPSYPSGSVVEFYYFGYSTANTFQVGYSSTTNDYDEFTWSADIDAPLSTYTLYSEVIPDGTKYVAFKATAASQSACIFIDNFGIFGPTTPAGTWQPITNLTTTSVELTSLTAETDYEIQVQGINPKCDPDGVTDWSTSLSFTTLPAEPIAIVDGGYWDDPTTWINTPSGQIPDPNTNVYVSGDVIISGTDNIVAGDITIVNGGSLTIEEGGQLQHTNDVELTMNLTIGGYTKANPEGYNLIATPTYTTTYYTLPVEGTNLNTGNFDLYYFDQNYDGAEWRNYKLSSNGFTDLNLGRGYLYANQGGAAITFTGNTLPTVDGVSIDLDYVDGKPFVGWNLVGNPYTCEIYIGSANTNTAATARPFYALEGTTLVTKAAGTPIAPLKGFFVEAENTGEAVYFYTTAPSSAKSTLDITVNQGSEMIDNAIIDFNAGSSLTKFQFNPNSTKVYMPVDGKDYAVVSAESEGEMPVCFKAEENGTYTMSFTSENTKFNYLHLIDNMTGADVDLLVNPNYTFDARYTDYASRFKLVFATGNNDSESNFGFISDGNLMILGIEGEATVQMIDVTGRILSTETFSGSYSKALNASAGVYMIRLIQGENVRTQKIVVK